MKKIRILILTIALLSILVACGKKTEAVAELKDVIVDQTSIKFDVEIIDVNSEITGSTVVYLYNTDGNVRNQKTIEKEEDLLGIYFYGLETETSFTVKVIATVGRDALDIAVYDFKTLTSEIIIINTVEDFNNMRNNRNGNFKLGQDIDFNNETFISAFNHSSLSFGGTFDGDGFALKNISIERISMYTGVFGYLSSGVIKNTTFDNVSIGTIDNPLISTTQTRVGIVAAFASSQTARIENVVIKNSTIAFSQPIHTHAYVGVVAAEFKGVVKNVDIIDTNIDVLSTSFGEIKIGGAVAVLGEYSDISKINSNANIDFSLEGVNIRDDDVSHMIGGVIAHHVAGAKVSDIISTGDITATIDYNTLPDTDRGIYTLFIGGLIGKATDNISNGFYSGSITVTHESNEYEVDVRKQYRIGGLIGVYESNKISSKIARVGGGTITLNVADDVVLEASQIFGYNRFGLVSDKGVNGIENLTVNGISQVPEADINKIDDLETYFTSEWILERLID